MVLEAQWNGEDLTEKGMAEIDRQSQLAAIINVIKIEVALEREQMARDAEEGNPSNSENLVAYNGNDVSGLQQKKKGFWDEVKERAIAFITASNRDSIRLDVYDADKNKGGDYTVGYGHKLFGDELKSHLLGSTISRDQALAWLDSDINKMIEAVKNVNAQRVANGNPDFTLNQATAITDFIFTRGPNVFEPWTPGYPKDSYPKWLHLNLVTGNDQMVAIKLRVQYTAYEEKNLSGLVTRRNDEADLYSTP